MSIKIRCLKWQHEKRNVHSEATYFYSVVRPQSMNGFSLEIFPFSPELLRQGIYRSLPPRKAAALNGTVRIALSWESAVNISLWHFTDSQEGSDAFRNKPGLIASFKKKQKKTQEIFYLARNFKGFYCKEKRKKKKSQRRKSFAALGKSFCVNVPSFPFPSHRDGNSDCAAETSWCASQRVTGNKKCCRVFWAIVRFAARY